MGVPTYLGLVLLLRVTGKRTLSQLNAFDFVVTVALGSTLATPLLSRDVTLVDALGAFTLLIGLQLLVSWTSVRWPLVERMVKAEPSLLAYAGEPMVKELRRQRITHEELQAMVRDSGLTDLGAALAVVLETNGRFTVIPAGNEPASVLRSVRGHPPSA